ncbi:MAG TPA: hypothetical protein PLT76_08505 [Candidatus Omnitrophota bacterium]|nr:hypothetical protein [Candidatus Omnitrophota bacterium]HQO58742.1 hypothetical protein [Candidatus Omnitrophota bacterium]
MMPNKVRPVYVLYVAVFVLAFCSLVYELLLAQALAAFLENTVLRYSVTIGLYMFFLGMGSLLAERRLSRHPLVTLCGVEILLTVLGGFSMVIVYGLYAVEVSRFIFSGGVHLLIIWIGLLSGFELPLLIVMIGALKPDAENRVLAINYAGAFFASQVFAFVFFPLMGLLTTSLTTGFLNACMGVLFWACGDIVPEESRRRFQGMIGLLAVFGIALLLCLCFSRPLAHALSLLYLNKG